MIVYTLEERWEQKVPKDDHAQIVACKRCRDFLKYVHGFRTECHEDGGTIDSKLKVKSHEKSHDHLCRKRLILPTSIHLNDKNKTHKFSEYSCKTIKTRNLNTGITASDEKPIKDHLNVNEKPHKCDKCYFATKCKSDLRNHIATNHSDELPFSCDMCDYRCKLKLHLADHMMSHMKNNQNPHKCSECSYSTRNAKNLKFHIASTHNNEMAFSCDICGYRCKFKSKLIEHMKGHMNKCRECSYIPSNKIDLKYHIASKHSDDKPFSCDSCDYRFKHKDVLTRHIMTHLNVNEKPHKCSKCSYASIRKRTLRNHIAAKHCDKLLFSCDMCTYRCKTKPTLKRHIMRHMKINQNPHKCSDCSYIARNKINLRDHIVSKHSDEKKPYFCNKCDRRFKRRDVLYRHKKTHLNPNERPHKCDKCSYTTIIKGNLINHIATKHRVEILFCDICEFSCKFKYNLICHIKAHINAEQETHKCSECSYTTKTKSFLNAHIASKHESGHRCNRTYGLTFHMKGGLNINETPYKCSRCSHNTIIKRGAEKSFGGKESHPKTIEQ